MRYLDNATRYLPLIIIVLIGGFLRFYKLDWGSGYFFHPDEYHIAAAVDRLSFPSQMNPELFSYGSFTVYLIYFTKAILTSIFSHFSLAILIGRFYSALFSTLAIILIYLISRRLFTVRCSLFTAMLYAALPGSIQQAHFATPESGLTFFLFLTLFLSLQYIEQKKLRYLFLGAISLGIALGIKIVALTFLPVLLLPPVFSLQFNKLSSPVQYIKSLFRLIKFEIFLLLATGFSFFLTFPYAVLDFEAFRGSLNYEGGVADGKLLVFYTRQFIDTVPILFQFRKIFLYALGPGVLVLGVLGFLGYLGNLLKKRKNVSHITYHISLVTLAFLSYFLPNAFLFAKWTRFMAPIFPFFAIFAAYFFKLISKNKLLRVACCVFLVTNIIWAAMFFSIYLKPDVRLTTTEWLNQNLPADSFILTESGNMLEVPLEGNLKKTAFDFYHLEENSQLQDELPELLSQADYFIIQSRRIFTNHQRLPEQFSKTAMFYDLLFANQLGFEKIKEFNSFPTLRVGKLKLEINDESAEETWSVFDHPVIKVYKKTRSLTAQDYKQSLKTIF